MASRGSDPGTATIPKVNVKNLNYKGVLTSFILVLPRVVTGQMVQYVLSGLHQASFLTVPTPGGGQSTSKGAKVIIVNGSGTGTESWEEAVRVLYEGCLRLLDVVGMGVDVEKDIRERG